MTEDELRSLMTAAGFPPEGKTSARFFAKKLGVSASAVRRWLQGKNISEENRELLRLLAEQIGWKPSAPVQAAPTSAPAPAEGSEPPRSRRRPGLLIAVGAVAGLGLLILAERPHTAVSSSASVADESTDTLVHGLVEEAPSLARRGIPDQPLKGQVLEPCALGMDAINGGCWVRTVHSVPCPLPQEYEHAGQCYLAVMQAPRRHNTFEPKDAGR